MSRFAVLASGNGSNFEALVIAARERGHDVAALICDRKAAGVFARAERLGVMARYVPYFHRERREAEAEIDGILRAERARLVVLAGFMRIFSPDFVAARSRRIINIHPSLLPAYPGTNAIERAFKAGESWYGVSVHYVDEGMDSGEIIEQRRFLMPSGSTLGDIEERIHKMEHELYPEVIFRLLESEVT